MEKTRHRQKDKANGRDDCMCGDLDFSAERNDHGQIDENGIIKQAVLSRFKIVPCQKKQVAGKNGKKHIKMELIAFTSVVFRKHTHPNHNIHYSGQDGNKYSKETGVEKNIF